MEATEKPVEKNKTISLESAEAIMQEWFDYYRLKLEHIESEVGKLGAKTVRNRLVEAIKDGIVATEDKGGDKGFVVKQRLRDGKWLEYKELSGETLIIAEKAKGNVAGTYQMLGHLCGLGPDAIAKLRGPDMTIANSIGTIFLACS